MARLFVVLSILLSSWMAMAKVVYLHEVGETRRVVLATDSGEFIRFLTPENEQAYHPEISSDGRYVAYSLGEIKPGQINMAIHVQDLETGVVEVWTPKANQYIHAEFSGNGHWLAYSGPVKMRDGTVLQQIQMIDLQLERQKGAISERNIDGVTYKFFSPTPVIIESEYHSFFPSVSTDGSFVIYHRTKDFSDKTTAKELVRYDFYDGSHTLLTEENGHAMVPSLSADDRYLAYAGIENDQWDIFLMDLWTGTSRNITQSKAREFTPVFAPDGSISYSHLFEGEHFDIDIYRIPKEQVFASELTAVPQPFIASKEVMEYVPSFSGDLSISLKTQTSISEPPRSSFGAIEHKGLIYIAGGHQGPGHVYPPESFMDLFQVYNPETGVWKNLAPLSHPRHGFQLVAHNDYIYAFGGFAYSAEHIPGWKSLDIIERYDINTGKWELLDQRLPRERSSNVAVKVKDKVYLIGGWNSTPKFKDDIDGRFHPEIDVFDLATEEISTLHTQIPQPLRRALTAVEYQGEIYILGGISEGGSHFSWLNDVLIFNPETESWRKGPELPFATFAPGAGLYNGSIYFFGGMTQAMNYVNTIYRLDLSDMKEWENTGRYLKENKGFPMVVPHPKGGLGILGGHTFNFLGNKEIEDTPVQTFEWLY